MIMKRTMSLIILVQATNEKMTLKTKLMKQ